MVDVSIPKPPPNKVGAKVEELIEQGHALYATAVVGQSDGRVRRPTLFVIAIMGLIVSLVADGAIGNTAGIASGIAMLLLAITDQWGPL